MGIGCFVKGELQHVKRNIMYKNLEDLLDLPFLQSLQEKLNAVYSFPSEIIDNDGKILTAVARQDICNIFHRRNPESAKKCLRYNKAISENQYGKQPGFKYKCPLGLTEIVSPIIIDGHNMGIFVTGQFFTEEADIEFFKNQAGKYGFEEDAYLKALEKVPVWSKEKLSLSKELTKGALDIIMRLGIKTSIEIEIRKIRKESEERLKFYTYNSPLAIIEWDSDFTVTLWSGGAEKIFGWKSEEVTGRKIMDINMIYEPDIPIVEDTMARLIAEKDNVLVSNNRNYRKDGSIIYCVWYHTILHDGAGNMLYILSQVLDVTESVEYDKKLLHLNADKDRFISILSHDLRSPLGGVVSISSMLKEEIRKSGNDIMEEMVNLLYDSVVGTLGLLEETLEWAKARQGRIPFEPKTLMFNDICENIIKSLNATAASKNIIISCSAANSLTVFADTGMIQTIMRNLVSNAIKFTDKGGSIWINAEESDNCVTISVSDNGIGIKPENLAMLFNNSQIFTTRSTSNESGAGLGLLLCKEFIEKHSGRIWAESKYGEGCKFRFTLPAKTI